MTSPSRLRRYGSSSSRGRFEPVLEVDGRGRAALAFVANADPYTYSGPFALHLVPAARFDLGLDFVAPESVGPVGLVRLLTRIAVGPWTARCDGLLHGHDLDRLRIASDVPQPPQADGEDVGDVREAVLEAERGAVWVLAR